MQHIVNPLLRHPLMPVLQILQVALACAIACNALYLLQQQLKPVMASTGIGHPAHLFFLHRISLRGKPPAEARIRALEAGLREQSAVTSVSYSVALPMTNSLVVQRDVYGADIRAPVNATLYVGDDLVNTLGLRLVAGRDFSEEEKAATLRSDMGLNTSGPVIVTRALADRLYPRQDAIGRTLGYKGRTGGERIVVGVVDRLIRNEITAGNPGLEYSLLLPGIPNAFPFINFAVRSRVTNPRLACKPLLAILKRDLGPDMQPGSGISCDAYVAMRDRMLAPRLSAVWLLAGVTCVVLLVTLTGIAGMTGYWVQQRTRSIGIRRALGARRIDILRDLLVENLIVVGTGVIVGLFAAYGVNLWLMKHYELLRLPVIYLPIGAALLLLLGQLAVLAPARRASKIPPIEAARGM